MDFSTPPQKSNPNLNKSNNKNVFHIGGIPIQFPYNPYGSQLAFMGRVISTLDRALKDGHCHALLESPTGTGKSLSLLCSALAWQQNYKSKNMYEMLVHQSSAKPNPEAVSDPLGHGGGFVPETQPSASGHIESAASSVANGKTPKKKIAPTIFYASRTHTQISQVIREYQKTAYRVPMAVLASRKHYCTNTKICGKENIDEQCKLLLKAEDVGCSEFKNMVKIKSHPSLKKGGCHEAHDIEDLVKIGQDVKGCSYYAARSMAEDAQLVFCPYSYIINPVIRGAMEVDIKGAIVILDEAHNIEDIARDAGSVDLEEDVLDKLQTELQQLCQADALIYQPLYEMTQDIMSWIEQKKDTLEKREFQHYFSCWTGDKALIELQEANISLQCFPILKECAYKAIRAATDKDLKAPHLSGMSVLTLEGLFSSLSYFFSGNGIHVFDYQLAVQRYVKKDPGGTTGGWTHTFSMWCLNPAVVFKEISDLSLSVILTSGTLSPMNSFSSELGVEFGTTLEAPHVIDVESQLWAAVIATGPGNYPMNASYKTADGYAFQDALGRTLEEVCKIVPGGALVFFPSYKLMEKLCNRWHETGQYSRLNAQKTLFVEPRGGSPEDFEPVLRGYYNSVRGVNGPTIGRKRKGKKMNPTNVNITTSQESHVKKGATFLAVCRGKLSEGIDFSDENARVVIVVGIPFPNIFDIQVAQKKKYNDTYKSSKNLLSGNEWYCNQAFRALNQAAGRCIRHRFDYGAIIFLDERFQSERNKAYVSKWLRKSIKQYDNFDMSLEGLKSFFINAKEQFDPKISRVLQNSDIEVEINAQKYQIKDFFEKKNQKPNKSDVCSKKSVSKTKMLIEKSARQSKSVSYVSEYDSNYSKLKSWLNTEAQTAELMGENDTSSCKEDGSSPKGLRYSPAISMVSSYDGVEVSHVNETPSVVSICKDEDSSSTIIESSTDFPFYSTNLTEAPPQTTPKKIATKNSYGLTTEMESSLNLSVNSHTKKRRSMASPLTNLDFKSEMSVSIVPVMDKKLQILCLECKNPLGLPENHLYIACALTLSPKVYLGNLLKEMDPIGMNASASIPVVISDISSVNQRLYDGKFNGQGIWSEADGCVFNSIFCPFCPSPNNCLGVEIVATDASNVQFLNKMLLYFYRLEIKNLEQSANKDLPLVSQSNCGEVAVSDSFDKYSYKSQQSLGGWRTTRSKLSLPKRVQVSNSEDQCGTQTKPYQIK